MDRSELPISSGSKSVGASAELAPYSLPGGYPNLLGPDDATQTAVAYGPNAGRLLALKEYLDPHSVFSATALPGR